MDGLTWSDRQRIYTDVDVAEDEDRDAPDLAAEVAAAIENEVMLTIGQESGIGDLLARAALRAAAEHFQRQADHAPDATARTLRLFVADQVRPPA